MNTTTEQTALTVVQEASEAWGLVSAMQITTALEFEAAIQITAEIKAQRASVEEIRKSITVPMNESLKRVNALFKPADTSYANAEAYLKSKILSYRHEQDAARERILQQAEIASQAGHGGRTTELIAQVEATVVPNVSNFTERVDWVGEVVDVNKIPREFMVPDYQKLAAVTKSYKGDPQIPGWRAFPKSIAVVRQS